jgi:Mlc titration factor MtfA (ptsG expression regulator)
MYWTAWHSLTLDERSRLEALTQVFVAEKRWEAARGFRLTDDMRVLIAAQACLLVLELDLGYYRGVGSIIVHPSTVVMHGPRSTDTSGIFTSGPFPIEGQAQYGGPIIISWDAARLEARNPELGNNVVFHEFAHKIDMLDGTIDGTPPLPDARSRQRWIDVCTREYESVQAETAGPLIREYGAVNPGEFFAVATEVFFCRPTAMREEKPELYSVLADFYRQNPAARFSTY